MKVIEWSPTEGDDAGKHFIIKRMDAFTADKWARETVRSLARAGAQTPREALDTGIAGLAGQSMAIFGHMSNEDCEAAFQGLMECCLIQRDPKAEPAKIIAADINDAQTLPALRTEAFKLNMDFFKAALYQIYPLIEALKWPVTEEKTPTA